MNSIKSLIPKRSPKNIAGKLVLITGAGSGIGRLVAQKLAIDHGARIAAWDVNQKGNEETMKFITDIGGICHCFTVDVSSKTKTYEAAEAVKKDLGKVDILINNAGIAFGGPLLDMPDDQIEKQMLVNCMSNFWMIKSFLPAMKKDGHGHIVNIASTAGLLGVSRMVAYCASKHAQIGLHDAIQNELWMENGTKNIRFTVVCPYFIKTGMFEGVNSRIIPLLDSEDIANRIVNAILYNKEIVITPLVCNFFLRLKLIIPRWLARWLAKAFGIMECMKEFKGRS